MPDLLTGNHLTGSVRSVSVPPPAIDYTVPGNVPKLAQPSTNSCWATAATIMFSWKDKKNYAIQDVTDKAGAAYTIKFKNNSGLGGVEKPDFLKSLKLRTEAPQNYTVNGWLSLLKTHGVLWVTTNEGSSQNFSIHARIIKGISGDGSPDATFLSIIDPAGGNEYSESLTAFIKKFEEVAQIDLGTGADLRPQVVHF
ncbi:MAG: papain-like cysteine protease family protein [Acidobacteriota bacterium]|nr:papain-like cysteine protease family protein [Acidobacteriota bacterium]